MRRTSLKKFNRNPSYYTLKVLLDRKPYSLELKGQARATVMPVPGAIMIDLTDDELEALRGAYADAVDLDGLEADPLIVELALRNHIELLKSAANRPSPADEIA